MGTVQKPPGQKSLDKKNTNIYVQVDLSELLLYLVPVVILISILSISS